MRRGEFIPEDLAERDARRRRWNQATEALELVDAALNALLRARAPLFLQAHMKVQRARVGNWVQTLLRETDA